MLSAELSTQIFNSYQGGILVLNNALEFNFVNDWFINKSGLDNSNPQLTLLEAFPDLENSRLYFAINEVIKNKLPAILSHSFNPSPFRLFDSKNKKDGRLQQLINLMPLTEKGESFCVIFIQDVTSSTIREKILRKQQSQLSNSQLESERANKVKSEFLANMSHEIRTPLNGMIGASSLIGLTSLDEEQRDLLSTVRSCGENLLALINDVLDISKIESGKLELESEPFNLRTCIEDAFDIFSGAEGRKNIDIYYDISDVPLQLIGDVTRLRQIIINLLGNAIKFTTEGEVSLKVESLSESEQLCLLFTIKDTGIGIPEEKQAQLFKAFTQVDASTTKLFGGTGLGLTISKSLVESMKGQLKVESVLGQGSSFSFTIMITEDNEESPYCFPYNISHKKLLLLEPNVNYRRILIEQLKNYQLQITEVNSYEELISQSTLLEPDIIFANIDTVEQNILREQNTKNNHLIGVPFIILLNGIVSRDTHLDENYFTDYIIKPAKQARLDILLAQQLVQATETKQPHLKIENLTIAEQYPAKLLLVEDNQTNQKIMQQMINKLGYKVDLASDGVEAVNAATKYNYDLIIMDVQMPKLDGYQATIKIRQQIKNATKPWIVAVTANAQQSDKQKCYESGMNDYLAKPVSMSTLRTKILQSMEKIAKII